MLYIICMRKNNFGQKPLVQKHNLLEIITMIRLYYSPHLSETLSPLTQLHHSLPPQHPLHAKQTEVKISHLVYDNGFVNLVNLEILFLFFLWGGMWLVWWILLLTPLFCYLNPLFVLRVTLTLYYSVFDNCYQITWCMSLKSGTFGWYSLSKKINLYASGQRGILWLIG